MRRGNTFSSVCLSVCVSVLYAHELLKVLTRSVETPHRPVVVQLVSLQVCDVAFGHQAAQQAVQ